MEAVSPWIWIGLILLAGAAIGAFVAEIARRKWGDSDEHIIDLLDLVDKVIDTVKNEALDKMRDIPLDEVAAAARAVYRKYVAGTTLEKLLNEEAFVGVVRSKWEQLIGVEQVALEAMQVHRVTVGPSGSLA